MTTQAKADAIEPFKLARKGAEWTGDVPLAVLPRLRAAVVDAADETDSHVSVELRFFCDEQGRARVKGQASLAVGLACQRCLEPVVHRLQVAIDLWLVRSDEQARDLSAEQEPFLVSVERLGVAELVEDDLLLGLPDQVCSSFDDCANAPALVYPSDGSAQPDRSSADPARRKPFDALAPLKQGGRDES